VPAPDGRRALVANQNDKKVTEIVTDYAGGKFRVGRVFDLEQAEGLRDAVEFPDRAPICLAFTADGGKAYVTLRGGGLAVLAFPNDAAQPAKLVKAFGKASDGFEPAGCGTIRAANGKRMYANSGAPAGGTFYVFDPAKDALIRTTPLASTGRDAHGVALVGNYVWVANRLTDTVAIMDPAGAVAGTIGGIGDAPDLLDTAPDGTRVFASLRGPKPATGSHDLAGTKPGVAVIEVRDRGKNGKLLFVLPIGDQTPDSNSDPHGIAVRRN
jgi:DNA-binding beta-propeller fold protein YncE